MSTVPAPSASLAERRADYRWFHAAQVSTGDIDPMYPVLGHLARAWDLDAEQRAWLCFVHTVWYHPGSTLVAFTRAPALKALPTSFEELDRLGLLALPTGIERRGHRDRFALARHLLALPHFWTSGLHPWFTGQLSQMSPRHGWSRLTDTLQAVPGVGRWAAYKLAELLQKVGGYPITAPDAGHRFSSGPRKGLADLYPTRMPAPTDQSNAAISRLDRLTVELADRLGEDDIAQVETSLCDFHSLLNGRYYLGHDIDAMLADLRHPRVCHDIPAEVWTARQVSFAIHHLGEVADPGWTGVRKHLKPLYRDTGELHGVPR